MGAGGDLVNVTPYPHPFSPEGRGGKELKSASLPLPLARQIEAAYQRFESAWRAGQRPSIEDHLGSLPEPARTVLLPELLELELSCRRRAGETMHPEEYLQRFPEHAALIESIFREEACAVVGVRRQESGIKWPGSASRDQGSDGAS